MANWLQDYIEMTEYIPSELREQLTSIRELDLQVHNAMDELERDIKQFFSKINTLSQQERQEQYEAFLKKCDVATQAASDKVRVADKLHDLVEKSMRLLDQGLEKLKEDLLEGDKAYIVEDLERRSQELDEQLRLEHENMLQRQRKSHELETNSKGRNINNRFNESNTNPHLNKDDIDISQNDRHYSQHNHRHSIPAQTNNHYPTSTNHRSRNNSTGNPGLNDGKQKKRERKRINSTMTIFNRNSRSEDGDSTNQSFITSPLTPDNLVSMQNSDRIMNNVNMGPNNSSLTVLMAGNKNSIGGVGGQKHGTGVHDRLNGNDSIAKQPILTAIDAAHAVSPNATNSDKLVLFSSNPNGDINYNLTHNIRSGGASVEKQSLQYHLSNPLAGSANQNNTHNQNQLGGNFLSSVGYNSGDNTFGNELSNNSKNERHNEHGANYQRPSGGPFSNLPLSSRHDPIIMAASQAINATQNMTPGRRTSSLKASYAAVNSGRLPPTTNQQLYDQQGMVHTIYCKCRRLIEGSSMIACDNKDCKIEWFHYECVGITTPPEGNWYCDECRASSLNFQRNHKQPKMEGVQLSSELL